MKKPIVVIKNLQNRISLYPQNIKKIVYKTLFLKSLNKIGQVSICLVDDRLIKELNRKYLGKDYPTDVLSFDLSLRKGDISCEIVVSCDRAFYNSRIYKTSAVYETYLYLIHGLLHILGYDDRTKVEGRLMQEKAEKILLELKVGHFKS
ncbi:MAG: rRNA maturation RNase YbeY [Candidatus Omnitrophota bacterium]